MWKFSVSWLRWISCDLSDDSTLFHLFCIVTPWPLQALKRWAFFLVFFNHSDSLIHSQIPTMGSVIPNGKCISIMLITWRLTQKTQINVPLMLTETSRTHPKLSGDTIKIVKRQSLRQVWLFHKSSFFLTSVIFRPRTSHSWHCTDGRDNRSWKFRQPWL